MSYYYFDPTPFMVAPNNIVYSDDLNNPLNSLGSGIASLLDDIRTGMNLNYAADTGVENAYVVSLNPAPTAYEDGLTVWLKALSGSTGPSTIKVNDLEAVPILKIGHFPLAEGDITANYFTGLKYTDGAFQIITQSSDSMQDAINAENARIAAEAAQALAEAAATAADLSAQQAAADVALCDTSKTTAVAAAASAATSAANAATSEGNASTSEDNAAASAAAAAASAAAAQEGTPNGTIVPWSGGYFTDGSNGGFTNVLGNTVAEANTHLNPFGWYVCDGAELNDPASTIFNAAGRYLPNLTDGRFIMGGLTAGSIGGSNSITHSHTLTHTHSISHDHGAFTSGATTLTTTQMPSHNHTVVNARIIYVGTTTNSSNNVYAWDGSGYATSSTGGSGSHSHSVTPPTLVGDSGAASTDATTSAILDNMPSFLQCFYIIKVK